MIKNYKGRPLRKWMKEVISNTPEIYKEKYAAITGFKEISSGFQKYTVFVIEDGTLMQANQPFRLRNEIDWKPNYFNTEGDAAAHCEYCQYQFYHMVNKETKKNYSIKEETGINVSRRQFTIYPIEEPFDDWYMAFARIHPSKWVYNASVSGIKGFSLKTFLPSPYTFMGDTLELEDGRKAKILEIKRAELCEFHNPLIRLKFISKSKKIEKTL